MESNDVGTYLYGWGMSIAIQRAKERKNPSPDVKVMVKIVNQPRLKLGGAVVPLLEHPGVPILSWQKVSGYGGAVVPPWGPVVPLVSGKFTNRKRGWILSGNG